MGDAKLHPHTPPRPLAPGLFARCFLLQLAEAAASPSPAELSSAVALLKLPRNAKGTAERQKRVEVSEGWEGGFRAKGRGWKEEEGGQSRSKTCHLFRVLSKIRLANLVLFRLQNATGRLFTLR